MLASQGTRTTAEKKPGLWFPLGQNRRRGVKGATGAAPIVSLVPAPDSQSPELEDPALTPSLGIQGLP